MPERNLAKLMTLEVAMQIWTHI